MKHCQSNTVFHLMDILEQNHQRVSILEHDPLLYEDAEEMLEYVAQALAALQKGYNPLYPFELDPTFRR